MCKGGFFSKIDASLVSKGGYFSVVNGFWAIKSHGFVFVYLKNTAL